MSSTADALRELLGRRLEIGSRGPAARLAAAAWGAWSARGVARPLNVASTVTLVGVGGAVLGGAGKTPIAIALARAFAERGEHPALLGHAYRARPCEARIVCADDPVALVGDDALSAARLLAGAAPVIVAPRRQAALDHAAVLGHRLVIADGLLQARPARLAASVLVVDARAPWGSGACPPAGDLRAPRDALLAAADVIAAVGAEGVALHASLPRDTVFAESRIAGAITPAGESIALASLTDRSIGLVVAVARPERIVAALAALGVRPAVTIALGDHALPNPRAIARTSVDAWLTTARCATKLPASLGSSPVLVLDHRVDVAGLVARISEQAGVPPRKGREGRDE